MDQTGAIGAAALSDRRVAGYVLMTPKEDVTWGPNAWAEDVGSAGEGEAVRVAYAAIAGDLVEAGIRGHWAMVPASDADLVDAWFSMSFGLQHAYALREPVGTDFQPSIPDGLTIRRPTRDDIPVLCRTRSGAAQPRASGAGVLDAQHPLTEETEAELAEDFDDPKYTIWVAEHDGQIVSELVGGQHPRLALVDATDEAAECRVPGLRGDAAIGARPGRRPRAHGRVHGLGP